MDPGCRVSQPHPVSAFDKYRGLVAQGGDFDIPAMVTLGTAYTPAAAPDWTITGEYQRIFYSNIDAIANSSVTPVGPLGAAAASALAGTMWTFCASPPSGVHPSN